MRVRLFAAVAAAAAVAVPGVAFAHPPTKCTNPSTTGGAVFLVASTAYNATNGAADPVTDVYQDNHGTFCTLP